MSTEVKIKIRAFPYYEKGTDPATGSDIVTEKLAVRGDVVKLSDTDYERAVKFDAIEADGPGGDFDSEGEKTAAEEYADWIKEDKPTVDQTVAKAEGDAAIAEAILEGENLATGGAPRSGVVEGLTKIIESAGE